MKPTGESDNAAGSSSAYSATHEAWRRNEDLPPRDIQDPILGDPAPAYALYPGVAAPESSLPDEAFLPGNGPHLPGLEEVPNGQAATPQDSKPRSPRLKAPAHPARA